MTGVIWNKSYKTTVAFTNTELQELERIIYSDFDETYVNDYVTSVTSAAGYVFPTYGVPSDSTKEAVMTGLMTAAKTKYPGV